MAEIVDVTAPSVNPSSTNTITDVPIEAKADQPADVSMADGTLEATKEGADQLVSSEASKINGEYKSAAPTPADERPAPSAIPQDFEIKDSEMEDATAAAPEAELLSSAPAINGTPQISKRASTSGSSKKKSSAVPEHKSKKLNKKKSRPMTHLDAQPGQYFIARMKGHPPWPSIICDEEMLPERLHKSRPVTAKQPDGTYKKADYADGGKRVYERTFPIMFLYTNEFAWIPNTELTELDVLSDTVQNPVEKGKSKSLLLAYTQAAENKDLNHFKTMLSNHNAAVEEEAQKQAEIEAGRASKKARKAERAARKSEAAIAGDEDEMAIDEDTPAEKPKSKKRKKVEDEEDVVEKPKTTKLKLSTPKTPAIEPSTKKKASKPKTKATEGSEEDASTPKVEEKPLTPQQAKEMKEKRVLYFRHKLQRGFLSRDAPPKEEEMKAMSDFLHELESFPDLESAIIRATKIHKVLKAMIKLPSIPSEEEFKFKDRSHSLLAKWQEILSADTATGPTGEKDDEKQDAEGPTANGVAEARREGNEETEAGKAAIAREEKAGQAETRIETTAEGGKDIQGSEEQTSATTKPTEDNQTVDTPAEKPQPAEETAASA